MKKIKNIVAAIYAHPETYPPTLSALNCLSEHAENIDVVCRQTARSCWEYPQNVKLHFTTKLYHSYEIEEVSKLKKIWFFIYFLVTFYMQIRAKKPQLVIVYDIVPLYALYLLVHYFTKKKYKIWYHNHDKEELKGVSRFSIKRFAAKKEVDAFKMLDVFTLPTKEREQFFPLNDWKGFKYQLANYPLKSLFSKYDTNRNRKSRSGIKLVYHGSIGAGHGLEEIIPLLNTEVNHKILDLYLVGKIRPDYKQQLHELACHHNVESKLHMIELQPFMRIPDILCEFDIGLAIHKPYNITYSTGGTASNKIYEYAACGLPVVLYDHASYKKYLSLCEWAFFTDLSKQSLLTLIEKIDFLWETISSKAYEDFRSQYNYERTFNEFITRLETFVSGSSSKSLN